MVIYLKHPDHGVKVANLDIEAEYDETLGWVRFDPNEIVEEITEEEVSSVNELTPKRRRKAV